MVPLPYFRLYIISWINTEIEDIDFLLPDDPNILKMSLTANTDGNRFFGMDSSASEITGFSVHQTLLLIVIILSIIIINFLVASVFFYR